MVSDFKTYEEQKQAVYSKRSAQKKSQYLDELDEAYLNGKKVGFSDVMQVGSKVLIGGGLGLLAGVATIAVAASAAEVVVAAAVTKVAGVVGGAAGLNWGVNQYKKKKNGEVL